MCVPGHDERDFEFAKKFNLPILQVISKDGSTGELNEAYLGDGMMVNSGSFNGLSSAEGKEAVANALNERGIGKKTVNYKLRDWVFSRQRYWGEPIPLIHCPACGVVPVPEQDLPVVLPHVDSYQPTDTGESPLALIDDWVNVTCPACAAPAKRETNTMPQWAGSSWYFLRYADVNNQKELISKDMAAKWLPVDYYVGGVEHAVLHLLYARFYTKFLHDIGVIDFVEPFKKLFNQGMICRHGRKMDKSGNNGVSPDGLVQNHGCDSLRMYELFIGPPEQDADWDDKGIEGVFRFLNKTWRLVCENADSSIKPDREHLQICNRMIYDITTRLENLSLNTVVSGFMESVNKLTDMARKQGVDKATLETLVIMLAPFAPHIAEELWEVLGHSSSVFTQIWPKHDEGLMKADSITIVVQINGKLRENIHMPADAAKETIITAAKESVETKLADVEIVKEIYVHGRLVNFVVK